MRSSGWKVPPAEAERARHWLRSQSVLRDDLRVLHTESSVTFPVRGVPPPVGTVPGELVDADFEAYSERGPRSYQDLLRWPPERATQLPRAFDVVGDIVLVRVPDALLPFAEEVGHALLKFVPKARLVARDEGVHGKDRRRTLVRLAGEGGFGTIHRENGIALEVDVARAYFSPRLGREHARVARDVRAGERVFDLCCGIGPFALTIAKHSAARSVVAVDANPDAIELLDRNRRRLRLEARVESRCQDIAAFLPSAGVADRVVLNLPHEGIKYLASVANSVARAGALHYYEVTDRSRAPGRPEELIAILGGPAEWTLRERHEVHPYSPASDLVAYSFARGGSAP